MRQERRDPSRAATRRALGLMLALLCGACRSSRHELPSDVERAPVEEGLAHLIDAPLVAGNSIDLVENGAVFDALESEIHAARVSVNIVIYIWRGEDGPSQRIGKALLERASGVACRIVIDPVGSMKFSDGLEEKLKKSGCDIRRYNMRSATEIVLARNHRKVAIFDGRRAITGGFGIWTSWEGHGRAENEWRDTAVRVHGPVVAQMQKAFEQNWRQVDGAALPPQDYPHLGHVGPTRAAFVASSPRPEQPSQAELMTHLLVANARHSLWIANSYFIPDDRLQTCLREKRRAGVELRVLTPGPVHDVPPVRAAQRATYEALLQSGVRIWEYQPSMMHAKTMIVDDRWVVVGSTNFDQLSFDHLEEGSLVADAPFLARKLKTHIEEDLAHSQEITPAVWAKRDLLPDIARNTVRLFSDWL